MSSVSISIIRHHHKPFTPNTVHRCASTFRSLWISASRNHNRENVSRKAQQPSKHLLKARDAFKHFSSLSPSLTSTDKFTLSPDQAIGKFASAQANFMRVVVESAKSSSSVEPGCLVKDDCERLQLLDEIKIREEFQLRTLGTKREGDVRYKMGDMGIKQAEPRLERKKHRRQSRKKTNQSFLDDLEEELEDDDKSFLEDDPVKRAMENENRLSSRSIQTRPTEQIQTSIKVHKGAGKWKNKVFPFYEDLCIAFGKDRAQGNRARDFVEIEEEVNREDQEQHMYEEFDDVTTTSHIQGVNANMQSEETSSGRGRKRKRRVDPMADGFSNAVTKLGESLEKMANKFNKGIEREEELDKKRSSITSEISKMRSFTQSQKFKVISMIRGDTERVNMFWDLQEVDREAFVKWVLEK